MSNSFFDEGEIVKMSNSVSNELVLIRVLKLARSIVVRIWSWIEKFYHRS